MKKVLALLVSCTLALSLAGCSSQTDSGQTAEGSGKKVRIMIGYENNPGEPIDLACRLEILRRQFAYRHTRIL